MPEPSRDPVDLTHATLSILFLAFLVVATFWVLSPFITSILWAVIICVAIWPILVRLENVLGGRRKLAVAIMIGVILLVVFAPVTLALFTIGSHAQSITADIKSFETMTLPTPPAWLERLPFLGHRIAVTWTRFAALDPAQRSAELTPYVQAALQWFAGMAGSLGRTLLQFLLTTIISAFVLAKGERIRDGILRFAARLGGPQGRETALLAGRTIRGVVLGIVGTAVVQAALGGIGLFATGVPAAGLLTAVMLFLCLAQLGPAFVLLPAGLWLLWSGHTASGVTLLVIGVIVGVLDNVIRPVLIKRGADLPLLLIFTGVLGGLVAFGIIGLFIGPVVLAVAYTLLVRWVWSEPDPTS